MQRSRHAVRYYIDRSQDGAEIRSVPVTLHAAELPDPANRTDTSPLVDDTKSSTTGRRPVKPALSAGVTTLIRSAARRPSRHFR